MFVVLGHLLLRTINDDILLANSSKTSRIVNAARGFY